MALGWSLPRTVLNKRMILFFSKTSLEKKYPSCQNEKTEREERAGKDQLWQLGMTVDPWRTTACLASIESWFRREFEFGAKTSGRRYSFEEWLPQAAKKITPELTWSQRRPGRPARMCAVHFDRRGSAPVKSNGARTVVTSIAGQRCVCAQRGVKKAEDGP